MAAEAIDKVKKLSAITKHLKSPDFAALYDIVGEFTRLTETGIAIIGKYGKIIVYCPLSILNPPFNIKSGEKDGGVDMLFCDQLSVIAETKTNIQFYYANGKNASTPESDDCKSLVSPVISNGERIASILAYKNSDFTETDVILAEFLSAITSVILSFIRVDKSYKTEREKSSANAAINNLSYSELEAALQVFDELNTLYKVEGLLIVSKIADRTGITRSVIVNTLRKLESAGVIETRSLGVKGTYIKIINEFLLDEIKKIR